ncbi:EGF-like domain-containing protein [Heterostelium album PN500]|uniref:EGF-like domain-containing protein n=1 Tax=Heterostelium pallidum (strain ATCC 26659 / Pp 5 / PN500) TaxID=670386 RepID=D3B060_HETP5|nr:EGF-like domain-containing protein [Heterostelium album PN500]EFA84684.1 EGF-like domain-containing protein [Heterostelium album PN500]|eukprot:XP_020436797.1 EGF-like domain-containing protein [Heterostelium album PN500]
MIKIVNIILLIVIQCISLYTYKSNGGSITFSTLTSKYEFFLDPMTYSEALKLTDNTKSLVTFESLEEYQIVTNKSEVFRKGKLWIGAIPLDKLNALWGWSSGPIKNQPFYLDYPPACLSFCANFTGNYDSNWLVADSTGFKPALDTDVNYVILESGMNAATDPTFTMLDTQSTTVVISNITVDPVPSIRLISVASGVSVQCDTPYISLISVTCVLPQTFASYVGQFFFEINSQKNYSFYFNLPVVTSVSINRDQKQIRLFGPNLDYLLVYPATGIKINNYQTLSIIKNQYGLLITVNDDIKQLQSILFNIPSIGIYNQQLNPPIIDPNSNLVYQYLSTSINKTFAEMLVSSQNSIYGNLKVHPYYICLNNISILQFIQTNLISQVQTWVIGSYFGDYFLYPGYNFTSPVPVDLSNGPYLALNNNRVEGYPQSQKFPLIIVYGLRKVSILEATLTAPNLNFKMGNILNPPQYKSIVVTSQGKELQFSYAAQTGMLTVQNAPLTKLITINLISMSSFNITSTYQYKLVPTIDSVSYVSNILYIHGASLSGGSIMINGLPDGQVLTMTPNQITYSFNNVPYGIYNFSVIIGPDASDFFVWGSPAFILSSSTPVSTEGGVVLANGQFFSTVQDPFTVILIYNFNPNDNVTCTNVTNLSDSQISFVVPPLIYKLSNNIQYKFRRADQDGYMGVSIKRIENPTFVQNNITVVMSSPDIAPYKNSLKIIMGSKQVSPNNLVCSDTSCSFLFPDYDSNGLFSLISSQGFTLYSENITWAPVITSYSPKYMIPNNVVSLYGYNLNNISAALKFNGQLINIIGGGTGPSYITFIATQFYGPATLEVLSTTASGILSGGYNYSGTPPSIKNSQYSVIAAEPPTVSMTLNGKYFGIVRPKIHGLSKVIDSSMLDISSYTDTSVQLNLPLDSRSGPITMNSYGLDSQVFQIPIPPVVMNVSSPLVAGGIINFQGYYLSPISFDEQPVLTVSIGGVQCTDLKWDGVSYSPYTISCKAPPGSGQVSAQFNFLDKSSSTLFSYQGPIIDSVTSTIFKKADTVTIDGNNFADNALIVLIGEKNCTNPKVISPTRLTCWFESNVGSSNSTLSVQVNVAHLSTSGDKFIYKQVNQCPTSCGENGQCNPTTGKCDCFKDYFGFTCSNKISGVSEPPILNDNSTDVTLVTNDKVEFKVNITEVRELDSIGNIKKSYLFKNLEWSILESDQSRNFISYQSTIDKIGKIIVNTTVYLNESTYNFAGDIFSIPANSVKYKVQILDWKFEELTNYLQLLFLSQGDNSQLGDCQETTINNQVNDKDSLRTMEIHIGGSILESYYSDRMIVDGKVTHSQVSLLDSDDPSSKLINQTYPTKLNVLTAISIQQFTDNAIIDPNFGSLLVESDECGDSEKKYKIPLIVVFSVVGGVAIAVALVLLYKKKLGYRAREIGYKLRKFNN